jgi:hypothetical protein
LAVAWSEHAFEIAFFAASVGFAAGADCLAMGLVVGAVCAIVALANRPTNADSIKVFENVIVTSSECECSLTAPMRPANLGHLHTIVHLRLCKHAGGEPIRVLLAGHGKLNDLLPTSSDARSPMREKLKPAAHSMKRFPALGNLLWHEARIASRRTGRRDHGRLSPTDGRR